MPAVAPCPLGGERCPRLQWDGLHHPFWPVGLDLRHTTLGPNPTGTCLRRPPILAPQWPITGKMLARACSYNPAGGTGGALRGPGPTLVGRMPPLPVLGAPNLECERRSCLSSLAVEEHNCHPGIWAPPRGCKCRNFSAIAGSVLSAKPSERRCLAALLSAPSRTRPLIVSTMDFGSCSDTS